MSTRRLWPAFVLWNGAAAFSALFVDAFLWHHTASLPVVVAYQASFFVGMLVAFTSCRSVRLTRLNLTAVSGTMLTVAMAWVALFGAVAVRFPVPLGVLSGTAYGLFFFAFYHILQYATAASEHDRVSARTGAWESSIWLFCPPLAGAWISLTGAGGYTELFALSAVLFALAAVSSPPPPPLFCPLPGAADAATHPEWRRLLLGLWLVGLREGALSLLPGLWLFVITGQAALLGFYGAVSAGSEALGYALPRRVVPSLDRAGLLVLSSALAVAGALELVVAGASPVSLIAFGAIEGAASACLRSVAEARSLDLVGTRPSGAAAAVSGKEQALNGGRLSALLLLLALVSTSHLAAATPYLVVLSLMAIPAVLTVRGRVQASLPSP